MYVYECIRVQKSVWETVEQQHLAFWKEATCLPVLFLWTSCSAPKITDVLHPDVFFEDLFRSLEQKCLTSRGLFFPNKYLLSASSPAVSECCITKEFCIDVCLSSSPSSLNFSCFWRKEQDWTALPELGQFLPIFSTPSQPMHASLKLLSSSSPCCINTLLWLSLTGALLCILPVRYVYTEGLCPGRHAEFV